MNIDDPVYPIFQACLPYFGLVLALPFLCILAVCRRVEARGFLWCSVMGLVLYEAVLFALSMVLGHLGLLSPWHYRAAYATVAGLMAAVSVTSLPGIWRALRRLSYRPKWIDLMLAALLVNTVRLAHVSMVLDWSSGTSSFDSLNYHIPRALVWSAQGSFAPYPAVIWQQLAHPYAGAGTILPNVFLGCGWLGASFPTLMLSLGAAAALVLAGTTLGLSVRSSLVGAVVFLFCPLVGLRFSDTSTDMAAAFPVLAALALARTAPSIREALFAFSALVGLGLSIKQYVLFPAIPLAALLFAPRTRQIITDPKALAAGLLGVALGCACVALSFLPIKAAFGDFTGGGVAVNLSNFGKGWEPMAQSTMLAVLEWSFEPIRFLPEHLRKLIYNDYGLSRVFDFFGIRGYFGLLSSVNKEQVRGGFFSLLFLPWLILGVPRGWRIKALVAFLVVMVAQFAPLAINHVGARFSIIPVAMFCLLWSFRAAASPFVASALALAATFPMVTLSIPGGILENKLPHYQSNYEMNRQLYAVVGSDKVMLLGRALSQDGIIAGRLGQVHFEYFGCPRSGTWQEYFQGLKGSEKWVMFYPPENRFAAGPSFATTLGPECPNMTSQEFKDALQAAGWQFQKMVVNNYELWGHP